MQNNLPIALARHFLAAASGNRPALFDALDVLAEGAPTVVAARDSVLAAASAPKAWKSPYPSDRKTMPDVVQICIALAQACLSPSGDGKWSPAETLTASVPNEDHDPAGTLERRILAAAIKRGPAYTTTSMPLPQQTHLLLERYVAARHDVLRRKGSKVAAVERLITLSLEYGLTANVVMPPDEEVENYRTMRIRLPSRMLDQLNMVAKEAGILLRTEINNRIVLAATFDIED